MSIEHNGTAGVPFECKGCRKQFQEGQKYWRKGNLVLCAMCATDIGWLK